MADRDKRPTFVEIMAVMMMIVVMIVVMMVVMMVTMMVMVQVKIMMRDRACKRPNCQLLSKLCS